MRRELKKILEDSAWYEGRKKDVDYIHDDLMRNELSPPNKIIYEFIEEFEYVHLSYKTPNGIFLDVHFSVEEGIQHTPVELHSEFEKIFGESLVPVGYFGEHVGVIEMSYSGKLILIVPEDGMFLLGENLESALESIFLKTHLSKISDIPNW